MGLSCPKPVISSPKENKKVWMIMSGLDSADTRTIFNVIKSSKGVQMVPTIGLEVEIISVEDIDEVIMNDGGRSVVRAAVQNFYYRDTYGLIFVVDSTDRERIDEVRDTLHQLLNEEQLRNKPILIFANKQDLSNSMSFDELRDKLNLTKIDGNTKWHLQSVCATQNKGLQEGLKWLRNSMAEKFDFIKPIIDTLNDAKTIKKDFMSIFNTDNLKVLLSKFVQFQVNPDHLDSRTNLNI